MPRKYVFADEAGNLDFERKQGASQYLILATVTLENCDGGNAIFDLRRELAWEGMGLDCDLHASENKQHIRDRVFDLISSLELRIDATILEKSKAQPHLRDERFYKMLWYLHMKHLAPLIVSKHDELMVVGASFGTKKKKATSHAAVRDVISQVSPTVQYQVASWSAGSDPCLQIVDYCAWALQRKWESNDTRSYDLIAQHIRSEFAPFKNGTVNYY